MNILKKSITYRLVSARKRVDSSFIGHAGMALRCLWAGWPCQRPVRRMLRQAVLPSIFMKFTWHANPYYRYL